MSKHYLFPYLKYRELYTFNYLNTSNFISKYTKLIEDNEMLQIINKQLNENNKELNENNKELNENNKQLNKTNKNLDERIKELENQLSELTYL